MYSESEKPHRKVMAGGKKTVLSGKKYYLSFRASISLLELIFKDNLVVPV